MNSLPLALRDGRARLARGRRGQLARPLKPVGCAVTVDRAVAGNIVLDTDVVHPRVDPHNRATVDGSIACVAVLGARDLSGGVPRVGLASSEWGVAIHLIEDHSVEADLATR